ncbi:dihydroorotate dehydrogenase electron transfer subunit [bacterium]|nr:dihydroorotate dehydrogenase electron transfer subunit [bacterium]
MSFVTGELRVTGVEPLAPDAVILQLNAPWLGEAKPGQFVMLGVPGLFLARPMSVMHLRPGGEVAFQIREVGVGTSALANLDIGSTLLGWGPLGNGFLVRGERPALVGGGVGMAPIFFLYRSLLRGKGAVVIEGNRDAAGPFLGPWLEVDEADTYIPCTEDGGLGREGLVTAPLAEVLEAGEADQVYACGPNPMLRAVEELAAAHGVPCQVALEARMACGTGGCRGCFDAHHRIMVCCDGPVVCLGATGAKGG